MTNPDELLHIQAVSTEAFRKAVEAFKLQMSGLLFPLGAPCAGYDVEDIEGHLDDWLKARHPHDLDMLADDVAHAAREMAQEHAWGVS